VTSRSSDRDQPRRPAIEVRSWQYPLQQVSSHSPDTVPNNLSQLVEAPTPIHNTLVSFYADPDTHYPLHCKTIQAFTILKHTLTNWGMQLSPDCAIAVAH
jgi:hypothetical protein